MAKYTLVLARSARRELEALDTAIVQRVFPHIERLAHQPRPRGCRKIQGAENLWRIRIGDHRVLYAIDDQERVVDIIGIRHRSDAYR